MTRNIEMKKMKLFTMCAFLLTVLINAQEVQHQSEIIRKGFAKGDYKIIASSNGYRGRMIMTNILPAKDMPDAHFEIALKLNPDDATESKSKEIDHYFADNIAFPVTYINTAYEGNSKLQKAVGYSIRRSEKYPAQERLVFVDGYIFILRWWRSKDDYIVSYVIKSKEAKADKAEGKKKKKKGFGGFIKAMKEGATAGGGSSTEKLKTEVLQPYLEKAFAKQKAYYATWIKKPENAKTKKHLDDVAALMKKAMKKYNDDIFNSPEYQRMLAFNKWYNNNKVMTAHNKTGRTIWVGSSKEAFMTTKISAGGSSSSVSCDKDMYYYYSDSKGSQGRKFYTKNSSCGGSVTIN